jgi:hypothetical protein
MFSGKVRGCIAAIHRKIKKADSLWRFVCWLKGLLIPPNQAWRQITYLDLKPHDCHLEK